MCRGVTYKPLLFDHLPKCGGSSLNRYLESNYLRRKTYSLHHRNHGSLVEEFLKMSESKRYSYNLIKGHRAHELVDYVAPECLKVTVFREPIDRVVSHYYYAKGKVDHYLHRRIVEGEMDLAEYVKSGVSAELSNWYTVHFSGLSAEEVKINPEKAAKEAMQIVRGKYDIVGFLEEFDAFLSQLKRQAGFIHDFPSRRANVTKDRLCLTDIDPGVLEVVEEYNRADVLLYRALLSQ